MIESAMEEQAMSNRNPGSAIQRWFDEVWNERKEAVIDELLAPECVGHGLSEGDPDEYGSAEFKSFGRNMRAALPDARIHIQDTVEEGDKVAAYAQCS
jgi:predicted ester cyclase